MGTESNLRTFAMTLLNQRYLDVKISSKTFHAGFWVTTFQSVRKYSESTARKLWICICMVEFVNKTWDSGRPGPWPQVSLKMVRNSDVNILTVIAHRLCRFRVRFLTYAAGGLGTLRSATVVLGTIVHFYSWGVTLTQIIKKKHRNTFRFSIHCVGIIEDNISILYSYAVPCSVRVYALVKPHICSLK